MKKIIAVAVASAFALPAVAGDVTINGEIEYAYVTPDDGEDYVKDMETNLFITGTSELNNGMSITGKWALRSNAENYSEGGSSLTISDAEMGSLALGDNAGPLDSFDDITDHLMVGGSGATGYNDMAIVYTAPTLVEGLTLKLGMSPSGSNSISGSTSSNISNDTNGIAAKYDFSNVSVYVGQEQTTASSGGKKTDTTGYGVKFDVLNTGIGIQYEVEGNDVENTPASDTDITSLGVTYTFNGVNLAYYKREAETNSVVDGDESGVVATYSLGDAKVYVESFQDDLTSNGDQTAVGIEYKF